MRLLMCALATASLSAGPGAQTFNGTISESTCAEAGHAAMRMGPTDAECTVACVAEHDTAYVLVDGKTVYALSDQKTPEKFAAQAVKVVGTLDARTKTIKVNSIGPAR